MTKKKRHEVYDKFGGLCAYSGTPLQDDWQVDHLISKSKHWIAYTGEGNYKEYLKKADHIDNLMPCQRIVNHYKRGLTLELFRTWYLGQLHKRLKKLPKNPISPSSIRRKEYLLKVAEVFGITEDRPFDGKFYFEKMKES